MAMSAQLAGTALPTLSAVVNNLTALVNTYRTCGVTSNRGRTVESARQQNHARECVVRARATTAARR